LRFLNNKHLNNLKEKLKREEYEKQFGSKAGASNISSNGGLELLMTMSNNTVNNAMKKPKLGLSAYSVQNVYQTT
jgi:hypothetical protein